MINPIVIAQARAFARQDGTFLGLLWLVGFLCTVEGAHEPALGLISNIVTLGTPFFVGWRLKKFRDEALDGKISFRRAFFYCFDTFFYATLLMTVLQFLYFKYVNLAGFTSMYLGLFQQVAKAYNMSAAEVKTVVDAFSMMKPLAWAALFMLYELIAGVCLSPIIAAIMKRNFAVIKEDKNEPSEL